MVSKSKHKDKPFSWRYLFKPRRPSSYLNPSGPGDTTSSIQRSLPSSDLSPSGQGGTASGIQRSVPSSDLSTSGQGGTTSSILRSLPSFDLNPLDQQGTTSNPSGQGVTASSSSMDSDSYGIQRSPSSRRLHRYDVFISFRGPDTRKTFVDHLYNHLIRKGIFVFKDDKRLQKGESISPQLLQAIQDSRLSIVVFSENYLESTWCLDELAAIAECRKDLKQIVFPVFYDVDPSHVRNQSGHYGTIFDSLVKRLDIDIPKLLRWMEAMRDLAGSAGWDVRNKPEFGEIQNIIQVVIKKLGHKFSRFANDLIGIQPRVQALESLLKLNSEDDGFPILGIRGMGGIGKTTLANVLYDRISYQFDACCFIENVSKIYKDGGAIAVQKQILRQTIDEKHLETCSPSEISGIVNNRLHNIKVLVVLDNVDQLEQLKELAINPTLLHTGSRMIITTRDEHILKVYGAHVVHEVSLLNYDEAHEFFCKNAFKPEDQNNNCVELIPEVLQYAQGLPLAIKVVGSFLCTRDATQWRDALDRLHKNPKKEIMDVLQVSIDGLQHEEKEIFLHIACFFKGEREDYVKRILDACELHPHIGIQSMIEKSLITIRNEEIHMHDMLQELGKKIVRDQCPGKPGSWSRLWLYKDFYHVLMTESGTDNVEAIVLDQKEKENVLKCSAEGFSKMKSLKLLILYDENFSEIPNFLSNNLLYLLWHGYPFPFLPLKFEPYYLVELNLPHSSIQHLWKGCKHLPCLKRMDLSNSKCLKETPSFEEMLNLERLDLTGCTNLLQVHPSIGLLTKLAFLNLRNCSSLVSLDFCPTSNLSSLKVLQLSGCSKLQNTSLVGASNLEYLDMDRCTSLSTVHESMGALAKLRFLSLRDCTNLVSIPNNINTMTSMITLDLCGCFRLKNLPLTQNFNSCGLKSLIFMDVSFCNLLEVPDAIGELRCLERLNLQGNNFVSITSAINMLYRLAYLNLAHCHKLEFLPKLPLVNATAGGRYFKTVSVSRDHRSGLYIFDCPKVVDKLSMEYHTYSDLEKILWQFQWLQRLLKQPCYFRCGFDIVAPWDWKNIDSSSNPIIPTWFDHRFDGGSIIRITMHSDENDEWMGFAFCVAFEVNNGLAIADSPHHPSSSSLPLPHPFYLSFESEHTEERFDMPLSLELDKIDSSKHLWIVYISRQHCHFIKTGAHITFKARPGLIMKQWGLRKVDANALNMERKNQHLLSAPRFKNNLVIENVKESSSSLGPKIQLPYNWLVSDEDEVENYEAKGKENNLSNLGL